MPNAIATLSNNIVNALVNPVLILLFVVGLLVFTFGIVEFLWSLSSGGENKDSGKRHMIYGLVGMFVMVSAYAIVMLIKQTVNSL
jgi:nitrogen fixation-related uncharacterized protein